MPSLSVIEDFDPVEHCGFGIGMRGKRGLMEQFLLKMREETLAGSLASAVSLASHAAHDP
jgi:hypothetical protein